MVLLSIYVCLSFLNSPRGFLGTDTGGKVATLEAMTAGEGIRFDPDIGYWAEEWDADGSLHPFAYTSRYGDKWVNVTTVPMLYAAAPLYDIGGYRLALLLPMLGSVVAAFAARALVLRIAPESDHVLGWAALAVAGLASPLAIYALDFWEHSWGVALMGWALVFLTDVVDESEAARWKAVAAGVLFGIGATMRTEAFVYGAVAGVIAAVLVVRARRWSHVVALAAGAGSAIAVLLAVSALEQATVGTTIRFARATSTAISATTEPTSRVEEALTTLLSLGSGRAGVLLGLAVLLLVVRIGRRGRANHADGSFVMFALAGMTAMYAVRAVDGWGFVPGVVAAAPLVALALGRVSARARYAALVAAAAVPLVIATQFTGGAGPQWGGRYLLVTSFVALCIGVALLPSLVFSARTGLIMLSAAITLGGILWLSVRSHDVARTFDALHDRDETLLVSSLFHLVREGGASTYDQRWLTALPNEWPEVARVASSFGAEQFLLVQHDRERQPVPRDFPGWERIDTESLELFDDVGLRLTTWQRMTPSATGTTP
jgi:hypothetical protein